LRQIGKTPGTTAVILLTFATGIGAGTAIFSILDRLFLRNPAEVSRPDRLRKLYEEGVGQATAAMASRWAFNYRDLVNAKSVLPAEFSIAGYTRPWPPNQGSSDLPDVAPTYVVDDLFGLLGVRPEVGRLFSPEEMDIENSAAVAVISHQLWTARFARDKNILQRTLLIGGRRYQIIGVTTAGFRGIDLTPADLWIPLGAMPLNEAYAGSSTGSASQSPPWYESGLFLQILMRTKPGQEARVASSLTTAVLRTADPSDSSSLATLVPPSEWLRIDAGASTVSISTRLAGVAAILLLLACANVATILLSRGLERQREFALRFAMGASRWRLIRLPMAESVFLSVLGGAVAILTALWTTTALRNGLIANTGWGQPRLELRLVGFAIASSFVAGIVAGLFPALTIGRSDLWVGIRGGASSRSRRGARVRNFLVAAQSSLCVVLLAGSGIFLGSLHNVQDIDTGYMNDRLVLGHLPYDGNVPLGQLASKLPNMAEQISQLPGVESIALATNPIMSVYRGTPLFLNDQEATKILSGKDAHLSFVSPNFFSTVGTRVIAGRSFTPTDRVGSEPVVIVSQSLAETAWPGQSAIDKCLIVSQQKSPCRRVIGVVANAHVRRVIEERTMQVYLPISQFQEAISTAMIIRAVPGKATDVAVQTRSIFASQFGGNYGLVQTMTDLLAPQMRPYRLVAGLFSAAGLCALIIAAVGIYASVAHNVRERKREMGVRAALGAPAEAIIRLVVGQGVRVVVIGLLVGLGVAIVLGKLVTSMIYGISSHNPFVLTAVCLILITVTVAACLIPALRAVRADPIEVLRSE
jgi:predicted permease